MDLESGFEGLKRGASPQGSSPEPLKEPDIHRVKSSMRLQYEAQVRVIRSQIGGLEKVREDLGLSQRKISQLLLVDPSAWTRWTRAGEEAPPHIWRALQWYLTVREKIPGLTPQYFLGSDPKVLHQKTLAELQSERETREARIRELELRIIEIESSGRLWRRRFWLALGAVALVALMSSTAFAQSEDAPVNPTSPQEPVAAISESVPQETSGDRRWIPIFYYTPETKYAGGALLIHNFGPERDGRTSQITGVASVTANGQYMVNVSPRFFPEGAKGEITGLFSYRYFPNRYFGRGPDVRTDERGEDYTERALDLGFSQTTSVSESWNFRWAVQYDRREIVDFVTGGLMEQETAAAGTRLETPGATIGMEWDRRDSPQSPILGDWHRFQVTRLLPQDLDGAINMKPVNRLEADFRWYIPRRERSVTWAYQLYAGEVSGEEPIPFQYLQSVGGGSRLRGYFAGRFRDRALVMSQAEWRRDFRERWSGTAGVGVGRLAESADQWGEARDLWTGAIGIQYVLNKKSRTKVRADLGFGHRPSFYLLLGDAF